MINDLVKPETELISGGDWFFDTTIGWVTSKIEKLPKLIKSIVSPTVEALLDANAEENHRNSDVEIHNTINLVGALSRLDVIDQISDVLDRKLEYIGEEMMKANSKKERDIEALKLLPKELAMELAKNINAEYDNDMRALTEAQEKFWNQRNQVAKFKKENASFALKVSKNTITENSYISRQNDLLDTRLLSIVSANFDGEEATQLVTDELAAAKNLRESLTALRDLQFSYFLGSGLAGVTPFTNSAHSATTIIHVNNRKKNVYEMFKYYERKRFNRTQNLTEYISF